MLPLVVLTSCGNFTNKNSTLGQVLQGEHSVLPIKLVSTDSTDSNYKFFLIKDKGTVLMFRWELPDSTTIISSIPLAKVRMKFDPNALEPVIKFRWRAGGDVGQNWDMIINDYVTYIVISCKEEDFPSNIKIN